MSQRDTAQREAFTPAKAYMPSLQRTQGQPPPIAANGGLSYMALERDGDAGTAAALEDALGEIRQREDQAAFELIDKAPPGPVETRWGVGFRDYHDCLEYIHAKGIVAPEGGVALPLPYTIYERPTYAVVSSHAL